MLSAFHAEVIAALQGVQAALNLGVGRLTLETNALTLQQELAAEPFCAKPEGGLVQELKSLASVNFSFLFVYSSEWNIIELLMLWLSWGMRVLKGKS